MARRAVVVAEYPNCASCATFLFVSCRFFCYFLSAVVGTASLSSRILATW